MTLSWTRGHRAIALSRVGGSLPDGVGVQKEAVLAARRSIVIVEEVVEDLGAWPNACVLPSWVVTAVACVPGGAWSSYAHGYYPRDNRFYQAWDAISRDRDGFRAWLDRFVLGTGDFAEFRQAVRAAPRFGAPA
jgi:glutaconate CoA-transferase subunit A